MRSRGKEGMLESWATKEGGIVLVSDFGMARAIVLRLGVEKNALDSGDGLQQ